MDSRSLYLRLLSYVRPYWRVFISALLCMGLSSLIEPAFPALMKKLLDDGFASTQGNWDWLIYPAAVILIFLSRAILGFIGDYAMSWVANNVVLELRQRMFDSMIKLPLGYFSDVASGRLMSRIAHDVTNVTAAASTALTSVVKDSLSVLALLAWMLYLNWKLTLTAFVMAPFIAVVVKIFGRRLRRITRNQQDSQGEITQVLQEAIEGHKIMKIFAGQNYETQRFNSAVRRQRGYNLRSTVAAAAQGPIVQFFAALALAVIIGVALNQASSGATSIGSFVSFITAMLMLLAPLKRLTDVSAPIQRGLAAAESVFGLIDITGEKDHGRHSFKRCQGKIEFDQVSFCYPGAAANALNKVSFLINPGECVALVGASGSGKTTIANLLPRFFHVSSGLIRIDGFDIEDIQLVSLRDQIALVSQEVVLFNDTIAANIAYGGQRGASNKEIINAAQAAHAMEFIEKLPQGLDTLIGEKGVKLSGGQRQRIAIARALLKNAPIIILDEATSALDTESERLVQKALEQLMTARTTLIIAHRLSTVERADRIIVMNYGQIVESGRHADLLAEGGVYSQLHQIQKTVQIL